MILMFIFSILLFVVVLTYMVVSQKHKEREAELQYQRIIQSIKIRDRKYNKPE